MKRKFLFVGAVLVSAAVGSIAPASATVVTFDDLGSDGVVPDGYGGINWNGNWTAFQEVQPPYNPESAPFRVFDSIGCASNTCDSFTFITPAVFNGAYFSGNSFAATFFELFDKDGNLVATSGTIDPTGTPTFLSSGYSGLVTEVVVVSSAPDFFVMDNVTYNVSATPLPSTWTMLIAGFLGLGFFAYRGSKKNGAALSAA